MQNSHHSMSYPDCTQQVLAGIDVSLSPDVGVCPLASVRLGRLTLLLVESRS